MPLREQLLARFSKFFNLCYNSDNYKVKLVTLLLDTSSSQVSNNLRELRYHTYCKRYSSESISDKAIVCAINELRSQLQGTHDTILAQYEACELLHYLCTKT